MPTTLLDGETWEQAYARRFREEASGWEAVMQDEINKAVDVAHAGIRSALFGLDGIQDNIKKAKELAETTEQSDCEFKYAKIAGQFSAHIDIVQMTVEIILEKLKDAEAAIKYVKGE